MWEAYFLFIICPGVIGICALILYKKYVDQLGGDIDLEDDEERGD